jgi:hypothetical protein
METEMKRILAALGVTGLAVLGASVTAIASPTESPGGGEMITICHATGSSTNPYVPVTMSVSGLNGHANSNHQLEEDIIPQNGGDVMPQGSNLDKLDIWNAGCVAPGGSPSPTPTPTPPGDDDQKITICHATGSETNPYVVITIALQGLNGHANANHQLSEDIIPPNSGTIVPDGQNWTAEGQATFNNGCVPVTVPPTVPPTIPPTVPPSGAVVPMPSGAAAGGGAGAVAANQGFNVQTAVSASPEQALAPWIGAAAAVLIAGAAIAARRKLAVGGSHSSQRRE